MKRQDSLQTALDLLILTVLDRRGPLHGYAIALQIEQISNEGLRVEEGSLYPALHRIEETGWVRAEWTVTDNKRRARVYEITAAGRKQLAAEEERWNNFSAAVARVLKFA
jgi:transcriptional regulator